MANSISYVGGVRIADIKTISEIEYTGWEEVYSIDFSEADNSGDLATAATAIVDGVTWTANKQNGTVEIVNGKGLVITPAVSSDLYGTSTACPFLSASVLDMVSDLGQTDVLCMQWVIDYSASSGAQYPVNSYEAAGAHFWNGVHGTNQRFVGGDNIGIGGSQNNWRSHLGTSTQSYASSSVRYAWETVLYISGQAAIVSSGPEGSTTLDPPLVMSGTYSNGNRQRAYIYGPNQYASAASWRTTESDISTGLTTSSLGVMLYGMEVHHNRTFEGIFTKFRLFRSRKP